METNDDDPTRHPSDGTAIAGGAAGGANPAIDRIELDTWFDRLLALICLVLMGAVVGTVLLQVTMRYVFNAPLAWSDELARYQLVWLTFLGAGLAYRLGMHIAVDAVAEMLKKRSWTSVERAISVIIHAVMLVLAVVLVATGYDLSTSTWSRTTPSLGIPVGAVYLAVPVGGVIMVASAAESMIRESRKLRSRAGGQR
jgi:TRAP-type transport system small permease protein